jgi:UDP-2,4-diacetamido-2,4,6-trideoxy-beta-L-altropyranose hydrolase
MRVLIVTEGGKGIGYGHISRCKSLSDAFLDKGIVPKIIVKADSSINSLLGNSDYKIFDWINDLNKLTKIISNTDILIVDSYLASEKNIRTIKGFSNLAVYIDDNNRVNYPEGIVVNGNIFAEELVYPKGRGKKYLLGSKYALLRKEFWETPPRNINRTINKILITFGGNNKSELTKDIVKLLIEKYPDFEIVILTGENYFNSDNKTNEFSGKIRYFFNPESSQIRNIMLNSDVAISAGGQTLNELARTGTPTIAIIVAENQENNVLGWQKTGFLISAGWCFDKYCPEMVLSGIRKLQARSERQSQSEIGRRLIDGKGSKRVVSKLLKIIK